MKQHARLLVFLAGVLACGDRATVSQTGNPDASALPGVPAFALDSPTFVLDDDGTPERLFSRIMARRLPGGDLVVADRASRELRRFARDGRFVTRLARSGNGPGEIPGDFGVVAAGDTLFVIIRPLPSMSRGVSVYDAAAGYATQITPNATHTTHAPGASQDARGMVVHDRLTTGQFLVEAGAGWRRVTTPFELGVLRADSVTFGLFTPADSAGNGTVHWFAPVRRSWTFAYPLIGAPVPVTGRAYPFAPATRAVVSGDLLWFGDAASGELRAIDGTGEQRVTTTLPLPPRPFDTGQLEALRRSLLATDTTAQQRARVEAMLDPAIRPATEPRFLHLAGGHDGEVWVRRFEVDSTAAARYVVINREGRTIGTLALPPGVTLQQIGADHLLAIRRDTLGVESVVEYPLRRR